MRKIKNSLMKFSLANDKYKANEFQAFMTISMINTFSYIKKLDH